MENLAIGSPWRWVVNKSVRWERERPIISFARRWYFKGRKMLIMGVLSIFFSFFFVFFFFFFCLLAPLLLHHASWQLMTTLHSKCLFRQILFPIWCQLSFLFHLVLFYFIFLLFFFFFCFFFLNRLKRWLIASIDSFSSKFGQGKWDLPYSSDIFWSSSLMNSKSAFILRVDILALTRWIRFHRSRFGNIWQRRIAHNQSNRERGRGGGVKFVLVPLQIPS